MLKFPMLGSYVKINPKMFIKDPFEEDRKRIEDMENLIIKKMEHMDKLYSQLQEHKNTIENYKYNLVRPY